VESAAGSISFNFIEL